MILTHHRATRYDAVMVAGTPKLTVEQFLALPEEQQNGCELLDGRVVPMADPDAAIPELSLDGCDWLASINPDCTPTSPPEVTVEIVASQYAVHIAQLIEIYLQAGVKAVWIVYPELQLLDLHYAGGRSRRVHAADTLTEPELLDGFSLSLKDLFSF